MAVKKIDCNREVTHQVFRTGPNNLVNNFWVGALDKFITDDKLSIKDEWVFEGGWFNHLDQFCAAQPDQFQGQALWGGVITFFFFVMFSVFIVWDIVDEVAVDGFMVFLAIACLSSTIFFAVYYYTRPKKEFIWNRRDGLITFPGSMWNEDITMPIEETIFGVAGPSSHGTGGFELVIVRPGKRRSGYPCTTGHTAYEDLSFLLWYMDRHRPLPPGTAFDPYRQQDYERRRAAGFPKPLFPARFDTPEATPQQQAERQRIGYSNLDGELTGSP